MEINLKNIEELIFYDKKIQEMFPEMKHYFDQWSLGQRIPGLKTLAKRSVLDCLNSLNQKHVSKLEEYFNDTIILDKIDNRIIVNFDSHNFDLDKDLCQFSGYKDFCLSRNGEKIVATFWR